LRTLSRQGNVIEDTLGQRFVWLCVDAIERWSVVRPTAAAWYPAQWVILPTMPAGQSGSRLSPRRIGAGATSSLPRARPGTLPGCGELRPPLGDRALYQR
jgi:hypothetical protein